MSFEALALIQLAMLVASFVWMLKINDEIPLLASGFLFYVASYRFWVLQVEINRPVNLENFTFAPITQERALNALFYIVLGQVFFVGTYIWWQHKRLPVMPAKADPAFLQWLRPKAITLGLMSLPLIVLARRALGIGMAEGRSVAFEISSYLFLFPLMLVGIATLILCLWRFGGLPDSISKATAFLILCGLAHLSFSSTGRFQFLGSMIAGGIVISSVYQPKKRLAILMATIAAAMTLFAIAGAMRTYFEDSDDMQKMALLRAFGAEDANMLDGFVLVQQVYPDRLPYGRGMEHLEILLRPIPRAWWPGKPLTGYMTKLGLITSSSGFTLGISPTLFGSFYGEGGAVGIVIGSILYGTAFAGLIRLARRLKPFGAMLIRTAACASLIPLLRGGDLPGIYAWIGMAFWPCLLVLVLKWKTLIARQQDDEDDDLREPMISPVRPAPVPKKMVSRTMGPFQSGPPRE